MNLTRTIAATMVMTLAGCGGGDDSSDGGGVPESACQSIGGGAAQISTVSAGASVLDPEAAIDGNLFSHATITSTAAGTITLRGRAQDGLVFTSEMSGGALIDRPDGGGAISVSLQTYLGDVPTGSCNYFDLGTGTNGNFLPCSTASFGEYMFVGVSSPLEYDSIEVSLQQLGPGLVTRVFELCAKDFDID